jgi:Fic-DOC domain mobile mystery protein B
MKLKNIPGATPIDEEILQGLIPNLTLQSELNEYEEQNIAKAFLWASRSRTLKKELLSVSGICILHKKMFGDTWNWAGQFRKRQTNIGVSPNRIQSDLKILLDDVKFWIQNKTYSNEEIGIRFHHRLVLIHPFPNGNGRLSRLAADLLMQILGEKSFSWSSSNLNQDGEIRKKYINALKVADQTENYSLLLNFAKS